MMKTAAAITALAAALLLAGCGDDHFSMCYGSGDGRVSAGYNSSCRGGDPMSKDGEDAPEQGD